MHQPTPAALDLAVGEATGLIIPAHAEALLAAGPAFLTEAFRAFGALAPDNRVVRIVESAPFAGGNSGHKLTLSVEYARDQPGLKRELFVKFSRDFHDAFRDRRRHELASEVRLARLSRRRDFPVAVPAALFADFDPSSGTGLLITERIAFGAGGIEPLRRKCMDHELTDPWPYYRALVAALAKLAGAHKAGRLSPDVELLFPFDRQAAEAAHPIDYGEGELRARVGRIAAFAQRCPHVLPEPLRTPGFLREFETGAVGVLRRQAEVRRFLHADPDLIALCHWNTNIDNAWFWRDAAGELQCGLLDWGLVGQMNLATGLWGGLCGAGLELWDGRLEELLGLYAEILAEAGGPRLGRERLRLHLDLTVGVLGLSLLMDAPDLVLRRLPHAAGASGPLDPVMFEDEVARGFLHVFTSFLSLWRAHDLGSALRRMEGQGGAA